MPRPAKPEVFVPVPEKPVAPDVAKPDGIPKSARPPPRVHCALSVPGSPDGMIRSCTELLESGRATGRVRAAAHIARGKAYLAKGEFDRAIADFSEALKNEPNNVLALHNRGVASTYKGEFERAIKDYSAAIWLAPRNALLYQDRARAYFGVANYERAVADYSEVIRLTPKPAAALRDRCYVRAISGRELRQAVDDCSEALRLAKNDLSAVERRGLAYLRLNDFDRAIADYNTVLKAQSGNPQALYGRGVAKKKKGDDIGGNADINAARTIRPDIVDALMRNGVK